MKTSGRARVNGPGPLFSRGSGGTNIFVVQAIQFRPPINIHHRAWGEGVAFLPNTTYRRVRYLRTGARIPGAVGRACAELLLAGRIDVSAHDSRVNRLITLVNLDPSFRAGFLLSRSSRDCDAPFADQILISAERGRWVFAETENLVHFWWGCLRFGRN